MRLLHTRSLELHEFFGSIPPYAILSHRWRDDEITFNDIQHLTDAVRNKKGFQKIQNFCQIALQEKYDYAWIDTCCIDKANLVELSEAINSMFRWYQTSEMCVVYLDDVVSAAPIASSLDFGQSEWFQRGWTLQELLAPNLVVFFSANWDEIGTKSSHVTILSKITAIDEPALRSSTLRFNSFSIAQRMSWAANRKTTRPEDVAYCLLGIFNVNMPLLYGEGDNAFVRLQEEIMRSSKDQSILAWALTDESQLRSWSSAFAPSPSCFSANVKVTPNGRFKHFPYQQKPFQKTNMGIEITLPILQPLHSAELPCWAVLDCCIDDTPLCTPLTCISNDRTVYLKAAGHNKTITCLAEDYKCEVRNIYLRDEISSGHRDLELPLTYATGRWSTYNLEIDRLARVTESNKSQRNVTRIIWIHEVVFYTIYFILSSQFYRSFLHRHIDLLHILALTALLGRMMLPGHLARQVRLISLKVTSFVDLDMVTLAFLRRSTQPSVAERFTRRRIQRTLAFSSNVRYYQSSVIGERGTLRASFLFAFTFCTALVLGQDLIVRVVSSALNLRPPLVQSWDDIKVEGMILGIFIPVILRVLAILGAQAS